ncbi:MAG: EF-P lysine aminoacylase EpmA [Desulfobacteraceae bacterium]|jgi:elongation factor P--(R)-beta-lysine ligase
MRSYRQTVIGPNLVQRARIMNIIRQFFVENRYLEVETPLRIPAPAPEQHIDAEPSGRWFLHTSPELCMKRLLAAGFPRIYQITKCFRRKERGSRHLPEMTLLEWYTANTDYSDMMDQCQDLILFLADRLRIDQPLAYQNHTIDINPPWPRLTVEAAFDRYGSISMVTALKDGRFDEVMGLEIEPRLGLTRPVFLCDYPAACGALARLKPGRPDVAERFELYIGSLELCNGFSELTDSKEQRRRFEEESTRRRCSGKAAYPMPEAFLETLADMPPASGNALGIDRLVMLLADQSHIDGVVAFIPEEL